MASRIKLLILALAALLALPQCAAYTQEADKKPAAAGAAAAGAAAAKPAPEAAKPEAAKPEAVKPDEAAKPAGKEMSGTISLPAKGAYTWWADAGAGKILAAPKSFEGESLEWSLPAAADATIHILNDKTGNAASLSAAEYAKPGEHKLVDADFNLARRLDVKVSAKSGKPVSVASVVLKDAKGALSTRILEAADRGVAHFYDVPLGPASLDVGSSGVKIAQEVTIERERKSKAAIAEVVLAGDIPTVAPESDAAKQKPAAPAKKKTPLGSALLQFLVALILVAAVVYIVYLVLKGKGVTMKGALEKAGIDVDEGTLPPPAEAGPTNPPLDPNLVGPAPGSATAAAPPAAPSVSGPRLVGVSGTYAGAVFAIKSPATILGRDPSCDVALPDDHTASRRHARIATNGGVVIHDEGSSNGTFVNGEKVTEREIKPGDDIQVGSTRFRYEA